MPETTIIGVFGSDQEEEGRMSETNQTEGSKPRLVGINHIAIEVSDIDQALDFYGKIFDFKLRAKRPGNAFIELGDQFINMMQVTEPHEDRRRHFGLVVDDRSRVRALVEAAGGELLPGPFLDFLDPWGNRVEIVEYRDIQFTKAPHIMNAMGLDAGKSEKALRELADKGMAS
jgi:predicted enzyme related to lactoylglutathione lyase